MIKRPDHPLRSGPVNESRARAAWLVGAPLLAALLAALAAVAADEDDQAAKGATDPAGPSVPPIVFTQVPVSATGHASLPHGSRIVRYDPAARERRLDNLTPDFSAAGRPDVSFDGNRILFVARRRATDPNQVWEMNADGSDPRRITGGAGACSAAIYLSPIYTIDAAGPSRQIAFCSEVPGTAVCQLSTCRLDGTRLRQITFNPYGASDPFQLSDGRILFSGGLPPTTAPIRSRPTALFTVNSDGTDLFPFVVGEPRSVRGMAGETPGGEVVFVESTEMEPGGTLVAVSRTASLHSRRAITGDHARLYRSPAALDDRHLLVSCRLQKERTYGIHLLDAAGGVSTAVLYDAPDWHELDAAALRARPEPAGRSSVVNDRADTGLLYCLNAYLSDTPSSDGVRERQIRWLQVFAAVDDREKSSETAGHGTRGSGRVAENLIGTVEVESDGSFCLEIPARMPLRLQTLDSDGQILQGMRSWIWVMPKEARGCIGCHEDRELSPPNRHALALRKPPIVVDPAGARTVKTDDPAKDGDD